MRYVLVHGHIFKNAGSTFDWSLQRSFGDGFLDHRDDQLMVKEGAEHVRELVLAQPGLAALSSHHLCNPLPEIDGVAFVPVYFLRHPLERIASVYSFEKQQDAQTPGAIEAKKKSFPGYVAWRMQPDVARTIRNYQTLFLAGRLRRPSDQALGLGVFGRAMATLRSVTRIGIVDRYDESMLLLEQSLRPLFPEIDLAYVKQNVSRKLASASLETRISKVLSQLGPQAHKAIDENSLDLALYQLVNQRLDESIAEIPDFHTRLEAFRARCDALDG